MSPTNPHPGSQQADRHRDPATLPDLFTQALYYKELAERYRQQREFHAYRSRIFQEYWAKTKGEIDHIQENISLVKHEPGQTGVYACSSNGPCPSLIKAQAEIENLQEKIRILEMEPHNKTTRLDENSELPSYWLPQGINLLTHYHDSPIGQAMTPTTEEGNLTNIVTTGEEPIDTPAETADQITTILEAPGDCQPMLMSTNKPTDLANLPMSWVPRADDPGEALDQENANGYSVWRYRIDYKIEVDWWMFPTDTTKVRYALTYMKGNLFAYMQEWMESSLDIVTYDSLMDQVEFILGIPWREREAKRELRHIRQGPKESISEYYWRISPLWTRAKISQVDRIQQFREAMLPALSRPLVSEQYVNVTNLLNDARFVEEGRKEMEIYLRTRRSDGVTDSSPETVSVEGKADGPTRSSTGLIPIGVRVPRSASSSVPSVRYHHNQQFGPVSEKPEGWRGMWYTPNMKPNKLTPEEKARLQRQGRCWSCRGSGHRSTDPVCPLSKPEEDTGELEDGRTLLNTDDCLQICLQGGEDIQNDG